MGDTKKNMDVLAVMDWAAEQVIARAACASDANRFNTAHQLREARAAIAELTAAAREHLDAHAELARDHIGARKVYERAEASDLRLNDALAAVGPQP